MAITNDEIEAVAAAVARRQKDVIAQTVIEAMKSESGQLVTLEIIANKLEYTAGWNCRDPKERPEIRKDQGFLRELRLRDIDKDLEFAHDLRLTTRSGVQQIIGWVFAILAGAFLTYIGVKVEFLR